MRINRKWLLSLTAPRACEEQIALFAQVWPDGCEVTPEALLRSQAAGLDVLWLALHPSTPVAVLETLAGDADADVRRVVAGNPSTPGAVLETLAGDADVYVRWAVAENPSTPVAVLETLAGDASVFVRRAVAAHPSTPVAVLETLAEGRG